MTTHVILWPGDAVEIRACLAGPDQPEGVS